MFDHVVFGVSDYAASKAFFVKALEPLGATFVSEGPLGVEICRPDSNSSLCIRLEPEERPAHLHLAFAAANRRRSMPSIGRPCKRVARPMARLAFARCTTRTTMQLSSSVRTGTTSKPSAMNPRTDRPCNRSGLIEAFFPRL